MEYFPWWNEAQKKLAEDAKKFTDEVLIPIGERCAWKKQFPWEAVREIAKQGWFGAQIPAKYGGHAEEWGVTGAAILLEEVSRAAEVALPFCVTMFGGVHQLLHDGTEEQRQRWLPRLAKGELLGSITMTEPYAGSDIAGIESTATRDGDYWVINGKKRFQTGAATADVYMAYFRTSDKPEDRAKYRHLTAIVLEKGTAGFSVEKVNEFLGYDGAYNCYLSLNEMRVPVSNQVGPEGDGWRVMMSGLNVERILNAAPVLGPAREALRYALQHLQRRVQFNAPVGEITTNQFKVADMIWKLYLSRLITYYAAYLADLGFDTPLEAAIAKMFASDMGMETAVEAIQAMGGNGVTRIYPVERIMRDAKMAQIAAGTSEVLRVLIYRQGIRNWAADLKVPQRVIDPELGIPMPVGKPVAKKKPESADDLLKVLAENYRVNPGLHMTMEDIKGFLEVDDETLKGYLLGLEEGGLAGILKDRRGNISLARATYKGLAAANPPEYYKYMPKWIGPEDMF